MTGSAKQSSVKMEVWIASSLALLAMTLTDVVDDYSVQPPSMICATPVVKALSSLAR
jgi:hypothetical protein